MFSGPIRGLSFVNNMPNSRQFLVVVGEDINKLGADGVSTYIKAFSFSEMTRPVSGRIENTNDISSYNFMSFMYIYLLACRYF